MPKPKRERAGPGIDHPLLVEQLAVARHEHFNQWVRCIARRAAERAQGLVQPPRHGTDIPRSES